MPAVLIYFWYLKGGRLFETGCLFGQGAYFVFEKQRNAQNGTLIFIKYGIITEAGTVTNVWWDISYSVK